MATYVVTGDQQGRISSKLAEIQRQVFLQEKYGHDPELLIRHLQAATEGRFVQPQSAIFKTADTDFYWWLAKAEKFAKAHYGLTANLRKMFVIPTELPWESAIPVFDPGTMTNRGMFKLLTKLGLNPWEEADVMKYSGSEASGKPTLHLIANSLEPDPETMGLSPDQLRETGKSYLRLRGYGLSSGLVYSAKNEHLDAETWTWFPEDRLAVGCVALGCWNPGDGQVRFSWSLPGYRNSSGGARVAISVPLVA